MKKTEFEGTAFLKSGWKKVLMIMKLTFFLIFLGLTGVSASVYSQSKKLTLDVENGSIREVFDLIESQSEFVFIYKKNVIDPARKVNLKVEELTIDKVLDKLFTNSDIKYEILNRQIILTPDRSVKTKPVDLKSVLSLEQPQQKEITGRVTDTGGLPLPGVSVIVKGTTIGTVTNADGEFSLNIPLNAETLQFSFVGMKTQEIPVEGRTAFDVVMEEDVVGIEEVVAVGYGTMKRSDLTGSLSSIERMDIIELPVYSIDNVLQGKAAGVQVTSGGYRPGETSTIQIRGVRSFSASNSPLIVLDGVPIQGGLMELNPKDVESIEVLKDASATAIYGSRGANGVILVTTRRGHDGETTVEYSGFAGVQYIFNRIDMMNTQQYAEFVRDAHRMADTYTGNDEDIFAPWQLEAITENRTTDWQDLVFQRGFQQNHTLSIRGGNKNTKYSISGTLDDHKAPIVNNDYKRISTNINLDQNISSWLRAGVTAFLSNSQRHQSVSIANVIKNSPMANPYDEDGNVVRYDELGDRNPLFDMQRENNLDERPRTRILGTVYAEADIIPEHLSLKTTFSPDFRFRTNATYRNDIPSTASKWEEKSIETLNETILNYQNTFSNTHRLNVTAMYGIQDHRSEQIRLEVSGLPYEHQLYHNMGSAEILERDGIYTSLSEWVLESYMLRTNYVYDDRYYFTFTGRVDGSSRLAEGNKYGLFPSMAVAWRAKNETFLRNVDFLSALKVRFSVGETGNTAISPYQTQGTLSDNSYPFSGETVRFFTHGNLPNHELRWERTRSIDFGINFGFFNNRIRGNIDFYQSDTYDLLMQRQLPATSGYTNTLENVGETRNRGLEFEFSCTNVQTSDITWSTDLNISTNRNEIVSLYGGKEDDVGSEWFIGQPINVHYYWKFDGIWQQDEADEAAKYGLEPGNIRVADINNDGSINDEDRMILGNPYPKWTAGITNRIQYKNLDFSLFVYTVQGTMHQSIYGSSSYDDILSIQLLSFQDNIRDVDYWLPDRPSNKFQKPRTTSNPRTQIQAYFNTSYVRIRNMSLGYTFSQSLLTELGISNARIYTSVQNPFTFTSFGGYDPEGARGYDMPNYTTFLLGINLGF